MCTHQKFVKNPYTGDVILSKCGHCPACSQERADAMYAKVSAHIQDQEYFSVFVTLNYSNEFLPFVIMNNDSEEDFFDSDTFDVYRLNSVRCVRVKTKTGYTYRNVVKRGPFKIDTLHFSSRLDKDYSIEDFYQTLRPVDFPYLDNCAGICYSKDFSNFLKRFRINYARHFEKLSEPLQFSFYRVSEYGPTTYRPHFHVELFFPIRFKKHYNYIRRAIIKSWPFCSFSQISKNIGIARNAASYVTSYSTRPTDLPQFYNISKIRSRASHSRSFGFGSLDFQPDKILEKVYSGDLSYSVMSVTEDGVATRLSLPLPQFVINRYFPKIKGFRFLSDYEKRSLALQPNSPFLFSKMNYGPEDIHKFLNTIYRCSHLLGLSYSDYMFTYLKFYSVRTSFILNRMYADLLRPDDVLSFYCNLRYAIHFKYPPLDIDWLSTGVLDYNQSPHVVRSTLKKENEYFKKVKKSKFNDYCLSLNINNLTQKLNYGKFKKKTRDGCETS